MPVVSVILPNYNHSAFLDKRLKSIFSQSFKDFELIILDDCSVDNSREVIERYRFEPRVSHIVYNEVNSGSTFEQWNKGISLAAGEIIWIAESDDWCEPTFLAEVVPPLLNNPEVVLSVCQSLFISDKMEIIYQTSADYMNQVLDGKQFTVKKMLGSNYIANASMAVFRKDNAGSVSPDYKQMKYCGDWLFWVSLAATGKVAVSGKYLNYYYRHDNNVASGSTKKGLDFLEGNIVYHHIVKSMSVDKADKFAALNTRLDMYFRAKSSFLNKDILLQVNTSLYGLDASMKSLFLKRTFGLKLRNYFSKLVKGSV